MTSNIAPTRYLLTAISVFSVYSSSTSHPAYVGIAHRILTPRTLLKLSSDFSCLFQMKYICGAHRSTSAPDPLPTLSQVFPESDKHIPGVNVCCGINEMGRECARQWSEFWWEECGRYQLNIDEVPTWPFYRWAGVSAVIYLFNFIWTHFPYV